MPRVIITAEVEDSAEWEARFRQNGELFRTLVERFGDGAFSDVHFTTTKENEVALYLEPPDLDLFLQMQATPEIQGGMVRDGVKPETVRVFVLDRTFGI